MSKNSYYTDNIMMWLSVDPMSDKYPSMSPYMYCAGNPIMINDPNGDTLAIMYEYNKTVIYNNGELYNSDGSYYSGEMCDYLEAAIGAIESLNGTAEGAAMVSELQNSDKMFTIMSPDMNSKVDGNKFEAANPIAAYANLEEIQKVTGNTIGSCGSGGTIYWDPYRKNGGMDVNGSTIRPSFIGFGHEMAHACDANNGLLYPTQSFKSNYTGLTYSPMYNGLLKAEWRATSRENIIRKQANIPLRLFYGSKAGGPNLLSKNKYSY